MLFLDVTEDYDRSISSLVYQTYKQYSQNDALYHAFEYLASVL